MTTEEKKLRDREKRYFKKFGPFMTIDLYNQILAAQDYKCGACGRPATDFTISMNIDHFHFKIQTRRFSKGEVCDPSYKWQAYTTIDTTSLSVGGKTQKAAIESLKKAAMPRSIRGLLCPGRYTGCNRLMGRIDKPDWLRKVIVYLEDPPARKVLTF